MCVAGIMKKKSAKSATTNLAFQPESFRWPRHLEYQWFSMPRNWPRLPVEILIAKAWPAPTRSTPFDERSGLFWEFSETKPTPEGILTFMHRYGSLRQIGYDRVDQDDALDRWRTSRQTLRGTLKEIDDMGLAVRLWRLIERGAVTVVGDATAIEDRTLAIQELSQHLRWEDEAGHKLVYDSHPGGAVAHGERVQCLVTSGTERSELLQRWEYGDVIAPARWVLGKMIDARLIRGVRVGLDGLHPVDLLAALWLQFAGAVNEQKAFNRCPACNRCFELTTGKARESKRYCGSACKSQAHRERQEARQMWLENLSLEAIAEKLRIDKAIVKQWIAEKRE
jgi:hypothetical protein